MADTLATGVDRRARPRCVSRATRKLRIHRPRRQHGKARATAPPYVAVHFAVSLLTFAARLRIVEVVSELRRAPGARPDRGDDIVAACAWPHSVDAMRTELILLVALAPIAACSDTLVTAPEPTVPAPAAQSPPAIVIRGIGGSHDLNSLDIETVEIIKGPAAATLYGKTCDLRIVISTRKPNGTKQR